MGLDQYAGVRQEDGTFEEIAYWRKHPNLQGWMKKLYKIKGGNKEFNGVDVELSIDDVDKLKRAVLNNQLPTTIGFFFGSNDRAKNIRYKEHDLEFCSNAQKAIEAGEKVVYKSSW